VLPPDYSGDSVTIGTGGGFVGREVAHVLLDNGEMFSMDHQMNFIGEKQLSANVTKQLFSNVEVLGLQEYDYMKPGNTYAFIEIKINGQVNRLSWDDMNEGVPSKVITYYQILMSHVD
jgi:hypothetical protein